MQTAKFANKRPNHADVGREVKDWSNIADVLIDRPLLHLLGTLIKDVHTRGGGSQVGQIRMLLLILPVRGRKRSYFADTGDGE